MGYIIARVFSENEYNEHVQEIPYFCELFVTQADLERWLRNMHRMKMMHRQDSKSYVLSERISAFFFEEHDALRDHLRDSCDGEVLREFDMHYSTYLTRGIPVDDFPQCDYMNAEARINVEAVYLNFICDLTGKWTTISIQKQKIEEWLRKMKAEPEPEPVAAGAGQVLAFDGEATEWVTASSSTAGYIVTTFDPFEEMTTLQG